MAGAKVEKKSKSKSKRKLRTEAPPKPVLSDSDSEIEAEQESPKRIEEQDNSGEASVTAFAPKQDPEEAFAAFYLRQATRELAQDLETLRTAPDFRPTDRNNDSVAILIDALRQGTACFSADEKARIAAGSKTAT